jgi:hypothetical protein
VIKVRRRVGVIKGTRQEGGTLPITIRSVGDMGMIGCLEGSLSPTRLRSCGKGTRNLEKVNMVLGKGGGHRWYFGAKFL